MFNFQVNETLKGKPVEKVILINHRYSEMITIEDSDEVVDTGVIVQEACAGSREAAEAMPAECVRLERK